MDLFIDGVPISGRSQVDQATIGALRNDISSLQSVVANKADSATVFLKTDAQTLKQTLENEIANAGKLKTISINGGTKISPDDNGNANITIDLSSKANQTDLQNLVNRVTAIENKPGDIVAVTEAQYEQLVKEGKVQQNVIYAVSNS